MGSIHLTTTLQPRGPAAAVVLDDDAVAARNLEGLSYTHRKEYAVRVVEAKEVTRDRRVAEALELLRAGRPRR